jgi:hypothetical protein
MNMEEVKQEIQKYLESAYAYIINDAINNLFGYPHRKQDEWNNYISVPPMEVYDIYNKFRALTGW